MKVILVIWPIEGNDIISSASRIALKAWRRQIFLGHRRKICANVPITDDWLQKKWSDKMASEDSDHSAKLTLRIHIFWRIGYHVTFSRSNAVDCFDEDDNDDDKFPEPEGEDAKRLLRRNS
jgi:hypothetical protein